MSLGGSKSTQTIVNEVPEYITSNHQANIETANTLAARPYHPYLGDRTADRSGDEAGGLHMMRQNVGAWRPGMEGGMAAAQAAAGYAPDKIAGGAMSYAARDEMPQQMDATQINRGDVRDVGAHAVNRSDIGNVGAHAINRGDIGNVTAGALTGVDLSAYQNPHTQSVVDTTRADIERSGAAADQALRARYAAGGAFGGSRQAVAQAENLRNTGDIVAKTVAGLRQEGFNGAVSAATGDLNRRFAADQGNQAMDWNVRSANQGAAQAADKANQGADITIAQGNQGAAQAADKANQQADYQVADANMGAINDTKRFNHELDYRAKSENANRQLQASGMNADDAYRRAAADQQAGLSNSALKLDASRVLAGLGQQTSQQGMADAQTIYGIGRDGRADTQTDLDYAYQDWQAQQNYDLDMLGLRQNVLGGVPYSTSTQQPVYRNTGTNALAGALGGAKLASTLGYGGGWGAAAGGLLGLLG